MLSALNNKLRRRNSGGAGPGNAVAGSGLPLAAAAAAASAHQPKIGPQRSTKNAQKLKILPNPELEGEDQDEESGRDVYSQYTRIKDPTARRDAARLGKADRDRLPRVTAYCTANKYQTDGLMRFLKGRGKTRGASPKLIDECIYTPYSYNSKQAERSRERAAVLHAKQVAEMERRHSTGEMAGGDSSYSHREDLIDLHGESAHSGIGNGSSHMHMADESAIVDDMPQFDVHVHTPEVFLFDYGVVVIWGMSAAHEQRFLKELAKFETEKLSPDDVEAEFFNFYYTHEYQARIYNDFITLRDKNNYMTKLAISHALAQSVKVSCVDLPCWRPILTRMLDVSLRRAYRLDNRHLQGHTHPDRPHWQDQSQPHPDQHADWRAVHPTHQHPPQRLSARHPGAVLGRTPTRTRLPGCEELPRNGSAGWSSDGTAGRHCRLISCPQGSIESWPWREVGVDW